MDHNHDSTFATRLREQYGLLQAQLATAKPRQPLKVDVDSSRFLCVWNGLQDLLDRHNLRQHIGDLSGLTDFRIIQVVGDSNSAFTADTIDKVKSILCALIDEQLPNDRSAVLEYGYTAITHDTNWIVNDIIATRPALGSRTIANLVGMSATAVSDWGAEATSLVRHFVLAYDEAETSFGSDMWLSDDIMFASQGDKLVCIEGGPQAFVQAVSVCSRGVHVIAVTGDNMREKAPGTSAVRFSAARLLAMLQKESDTRPLRGLDEEVSEYLASCFDMSNSGDVRKYKTVAGAMETVLNSPGMMAPLEVISLQWAG